MAKPEWGIKRLCQSCGTKYYDFRAQPIVCPNCGATFDPDALLKSRRTRGSTAKADEAAKPKPAPKAAKKEEDEAEEEDAELPEEEDAETGDDDLETADGDDEEDEDMIEDASELGEDEDDMAEVVVEDDAGDDNDR